MAENKKEFNLKLYAVIAFFLVAAMLFGITAVTYKNKYSGFSAEKTAIAFTETIVNRGDGYNAYKNTLLSKNYKYGDFIREYYIYPVIYRDCNYEVLASRENLKGYDDESFKSEKTLNDTGELSGFVIDKMYPYFLSLMMKYNGWDNYDKVFTEYFNKLASVRETVFGDKYLTDEIMFTALEANVKTYGNFITGTEEVIDENTGVKLSEKINGIYKEKYGKDYKIEYEIEKTTELSDVKSFVNTIDDENLNKYKILKDDISQAKCVTVNVIINGKIRKVVNVYTVKINSTWYVENTNTKTDILYELFEKE